MAEVDFNQSRNLGSLLRLSLTMLWRDWQGGELRLLFLALVMAVSSVTGIALFTDRLEQALLLESANMLAADRVLSGRSEAPAEWLEEARSLGLQTAETISFTSMAFSDTGNMLVAAKAVSAAYPLRGEIIAADAPFVRGYPVTGGPPPGEVWLESRVLPALDIDIGDSVYVGEAELRVGRIIVVEPDRQQGGMVDNAGPRLMMNIADVPATNVIQPGSRVRYRYLFAGDLAQLDFYSGWIREASAGEFRLRDVRDESEEVSDALNKAESFLMLGSLFAVLLAGVAIALTAKRYSERHFDYVAILKTLGCTSNQITTIYVSIQLALAAIAIVVGSLLGWLIHQLILRLLASILTVELPAASFQPFVIGALTALICLLSFALPPLLALRHTSPLRVLRKDLDQNRIGANVPYLFGIAGSIFLIFWYSQDLILTSVLVASVAGIVVVLSALSYLLLKSSGSVGMRAGSAWKLAMSATRRRRKQNVLQVLVFSITIMSLLVLTLLRTELIDDWQAQLPENTPNHFMMNVTQSQIEGIRAFFDENGIQENNFFPIMGARPIAINGEEPNPRRDNEDERGNVTERAGEQARGASASGAGEEDQEGEGGEGDRGGRVGTRQVTWTDRLPPENQIVAGSWWGSDAQPGLVSVEEDYARWLGVEIGDRIEFEANRQFFEAEVTSLRSVRWDNMQPNFYFIFSPGTLDHFGATYLSTALMEQDQKILLNELIRRFPTIVVIEIDALIEQIQTIIAQVTSAIELISLLVLACGALVLLSCVNATLDERFRENAILRTLGAGRRLILSSLAIEFASIGLVAGIIATIGAEASLYYLQEFIFEQNFTLHFWVWVAGPLLGMVLIGLLGLNSTRRVVSVSPLNVLRRV
ncbi:MAG: FtsX-like permease family protein [Gammaproteobacteria bacterium]|nr:FtsX-like permease family protein [Pseudomonadales bacterium]MCP5349156.1 FtsX-like permease family protein [Pseudomonadales bacterium]